MPEMWEFEGVRFTSKDDIIDMLVRRLAAIQDNGRMKGTA